VKWESGVMGEQKRVVSKEIKKVDLKLLRKFSIAKIEISLPINLPTTLSTPKKKKSLCTKVNSPKNEEERTKPPYSAHITSSSTHNEQTSEESERESSKW
jgi:hypothetical protein